MKEGQRIAILHEKHGLIQKGERGRIEQIFDNNMIEIQFDNGECLVFFADDIEYETWD